MPSDIADAYGPLSVGSWRLHGAKTEELVVVTLPSRPRPTTSQQIPAINPRDQVALARELQSELKRAGCYRSEINGVWSGPTRQAMRAFMDRVNAKLPTEQPDSILLTLVRSHPGRVCGEPCPESQSLADGDRCVLTALMAQPKGAIRYRSLTPSRSRHASAPLSGNSGAGAPASQSRHACYRSERDGLVFDLVEYVHGWRSLVQSPPSRSVSTPQTWQKRISAHARARAYCANGSDSTSGNLRRVDTNHPARGRAARRRHAFALDPWAGTQGRAQPGPSSVTGRGY
jgi:hypothetical protein